MTAASTSTLNLLGDAVPLKSANAKPEATALVEVLLTLRAHPMVAWCERSNSGAANISGTSFGSAGPNALTYLGN